MRLIDAEDILVGWQRTGIEEYDEGKEAGIDLVLAIIDHLPTIKAKPVVHAHWENEHLNRYGHLCHCCSNCGFSASHKDKNWCANCGAQMDESISCSHEDVPKIMEEMEK